MGRLLEESFPEIEKVTDRRGHLRTGVSALTLAVLGDKSFQIAVGNTYRTAKTVHDQLTVLDPAVDRSRGNSRKLRNLSDGEELWL
jgi:hypothetical protein